MFTLGYLLEITALSTDGGLTAAKVTYMGSAFCPAFNLLFVAKYCDKKLPKGVVGVLFAVPLAILALVWTTATTGLFYVSYEYSSHTPVRYLSKVNGPFYNTTHVYAAVCVIATFVIIYRRYKKVDARTRNNLKLLILATIVPTFFNILYLLNLRIFNINYGPVSLTIVNVILYLCIRKYDLLDFMPIASEMALKSMRDSFVLVNKDYKFLQANEAAAKLIPALGDVQKFTPLEQISGWPEALLAEDIGKAPLIEFEMPPGRYYKAGISAVAGRDKKVMGYMFLIQDVTEHTLYANAINEAKERAERANVEKSKFLATMSHELRTPLNAIIGISEIELGRDDYPQEVREPLQKINNSGHMLLGIVSDILDLSKIEAGKLEIVPARYDMPSLINDAVQLNITRIGAKNIVFKLKVSEQLPRYLCGDELRIKQVLNNLLSNAIKYTKEGEVGLEFTVEEGGGPNYCLLAVKVSDTGQGMTPKQVARLFDEYSRFNLEANRETEGTGLGMNITKRLVEMMGGKLTVASEPGVGTTFTAVFAQEIVGPEVIGAETANNLQNFTELDDRYSRKRKIERKPMPHARVLVVDDVETNLYVASGLLTPYGLKLETAQSGFEALDKVKRGEVYDIIFMDHMMPEMDGIETTRQIRESGYSQPIVALTANAVAGQAEVFAANGFDGFISKPIDVAELDNILHKFIEDKDPQNGEAPPPPPYESVISNEKLLGVFVRDAKKVLPILQNTLDNIDDLSDEGLRLFKVNIHAMKSSFAIIGETAAAKQAALLETAAAVRDLAAIQGGLPQIIEALADIIEKQEAAEASNSVDEDPAFLRQQLEIIAKACEDYDDLTANAALKELEQRPWGKETGELVAKISQLLLGSEFELAAEAARFAGNR
ncbi:MAG: response regulator, partial [Lachnospiraceae bacterium]|jgi:signal transduction histidine kinase/ActR/RegA family two-component response regulator|nr:response regulator [Lachnospiraceae bacterium]